MKLSIVSTLYRSATHLKEFHRRASFSARQVAGSDYEIILVNDGSPDDSLELAVQLTKSDPNLTVVDLSRNFGHHKAMMTGLMHTTGDRIFLLDCDLEEDPEILVDFTAQFEQTSCDVVYGVQNTRKGGVFERISGMLFYKIFKLLTGLALPANIVVARLMTRRYVDALVRHQEREIFMAGLWLVTGFTQVPYIITKHSRGQTTYTFRRKIALLVNSITSFSSLPLIGIFFIGCAIFAASGVYTLYLILHWFFFAQPPDGYTSLMASTWLLGGMIMASLGVIGIYLSKIYSETKARPYTIVRQIFKNDLQEEA